MLLLGAGRRDAATDSSSAELGVAAATERYPCAAPHPHQLLLVTAGFSPASALSPSRNIMIQKHDSITVAVHKLAS